MVITYTKPNKPLKDSRGHWRTKSLFKEYISMEEFGDGTPVAPLFTIEEYDDIEGCLPSFKRLYVEIGDPTEYKQAKELLGSVDHWEYLKKSTWMKELLDSCKKELALKLESEAFEAIKQEGLTSDKAQIRIQAFKTILTEAQNRNEDNQVEKRKAGRPTKAEVAAELKNLTKDQKKVLNDYERINNQKETTGKEEEATKH